MTEQTTTPAAPTFSPDYSIAYGEKYAAGKGKDITEIARMVRKDIKQAIKEGALPEGIKVSVRSERFSGGRALRCRVTEAPYDVMRPATPEETAKWGVTRMQCEHVREIEDLIEAIAKAYGYDGSDTQYDYWNVSYYCSVSHAS